MATTRPFENQTNEFVWNQLNMHTARCVEVMAMPEAERMVARNGAKQDVPFQGVGWLSAIWATHAEHELKQRGLI